MKNRYIVLLLFILLSLTVSAQNNGEDMIYLKNGSIYRGTIIEQIPGVSYKIEIAGGSVIVISAVDVEKITKERKVSAESGYGTEGRVRAPVFHYRNKGYFFQGQGLVEVVKTGIRIVNGYKFNQFSYLGLGVGVDLIVTDATTFTFNYSGVYFPFYAFYSGDILKKHTTPFYTLEAGYSYRLNQVNTYYSASYATYTGGSGGFMAGAGFGVKFYSRRRVHFSLSANVDFLQAINHYTKEHYSNPGGYTYTYSKTSTILINPGLRIGLGF